MIINKLYKKRILSEIKKGRFDARILNNQGLDFDSLLEIWTYYLDTRDEKHYPIIKKQEDLLLAISQGIDPECISLAILESAKRTYEHLLRDSEEDDTVLKD